MVVDSSNRLRWRWISDPWGQLPPEENPAGLGTFSLNLRLPGQLYDRESNLHYNYFRDYSPSGVEWGGRLPPINPAYRPNNNFTDAAGYFNERGDFVCLRWRCDPQDQFRPPRLASDYMPAATDPRNPPDGCVCDDPRFRLPNGPPPPSLDKLLEAGAQAYGDYGRGLPRLPAGR